jgi:DNA-binding response OmpR family regulator
MNGKSILIADDDHNLVDALAVRCRTLGLAVRTAHDARTALNIIFDDRPDVACLDVNMPCGNGLCVCEMLASDERFVSLPVIVLTGRTDLETVRRCHNLCAYYVPKCADLWSRIGPLLQELLPETGNGNPTP